MVDFDFDLKRIELLNFQSKDEFYFFKVSINDGQLVFDYKICFKGNKKFDFICDYIVLLDQDFDNKQIMRMVTNFDNLYDLSVDYDSIGGKVFKSNTELENKTKIIEFFKKNFFNIYRFDYVFRNLHFLSILIRKKQIIFVN